MASALGIGALKRSQLEVLQTLVGKHLTDPSLVDVASGDDFTVTSLERGIPRYEHPHLVAALDVFLMYQRNRRAQGPLGLPSTRSTYKQDPRTRLIELYKRWLRSNAANASVGEEDVRRMCALCRDVLNHPKLFPSRNPRSFMHTLAEVYDHLKLQLREVLEHDRTCAELAARALCLSRNLISDAITFLLLGATDLKQTDKLPSVEVVYLWQSLPANINPLPARADKSLQKVMKEAWLTQCGTLIATLISVRWAFRLFDGAGAEDEAAATGFANNNATGASDSIVPAAAAHPAESIPALIAQVAAEFEKGNFKACGLAGAFREPAQAAGRRSYLRAVEAVFDLVYLLGDVLVLFHRLSDGLGDYGMIRVAPWLHPFLEGLVDKVQKLRESLESLNETVDNELVLAKARGRKVKQPAPSQTMSSRAHAAIDRAITGGDCHITMLLAVFEELRARSAPERLPHVMEGLGDACFQLQKVLASPQFLARVGDCCRDLPPLSSMAAMSQVRDDPSSFVAIEVEGDMSEDEGGTPAASRAASPAALLRRVDSGATNSNANGDSITGLHMRRRAASAGRATKDAFKRLTGRSQPDQQDDADHTDAPSTAPQSLDAQEDADSSTFVSARPPATTGCSTDLEDEAAPEVREAEQPPEPPPEPPTTDSSPVAAPPVPRVPSAASGLTPAGVLKADVYRLTIAMKGWKRHDQRCLVLREGSLRIFEKGSKDQVKTVVKIPEELEQSSLLSKGIMSMQIRRARKSSSSFWNNGGASTDESEQKVYLFEFVEPDLADQFLAELTRLQRLSVG